MKTELPLNKDSFKRTKKISLPKKKNKKKNKKSNIS